MNECRDLFILLHMESSSIQSALSNLIGQASNAVIRIASEKMVEFDLPTLDDFISTAKASLEINVFEYKKDQNGYSIYIEGCPIKHLKNVSLCDESTMCPLIFLCLCAIKKEAGVEAEIIRTEHTNDGVTALIRPYFKSWEELIQKVGE